MSNQNNNGNNSVKHIKENFTFNRSNTPVHYPNLAISNNPNNLSPLDIKSNVNNNNINNNVIIELNNNKKRYDSNKVSSKIINNIVNDVISTKALFSPGGNNFFSNDSKNKI